MSNGHDRNPDNGHKPDGEFDGVTYLYIRTNPADDGSEPLASGLKHWHSPDIMIVKPGGAVGTEAVALEENQVRVTVTNGGGIEAVDAFVDVFFANPSTGFTPATATLVGSTYLTIPGYSTRTHDFPWTPGSSDAGHRCLLARVALWIPPDAYTDPTIFDVKGDRHVAQRNIHVVALEDGAEMMRFAFLVVNMLDRATEFRLVAREITDGEGQQAMRAAIGCEFAQFGEKPLGGFGLTLGDERFAHPEDAADRDLLAERFDLPATGLMTLVPDAGKPEASLTLEPGEVRQAVLTVARNPATRGGDLHAVDVQQIAGKGEIVGGLTVVVRH